MNLKTMGAEIILGNTYHLYLQAGHGRYFPTGRSAYIYELGAARY